MLGRGSSTSIKDDSLGRGTIRYVETAAGSVRVDSFVIPLAEIDRKPGHDICFAYYASSPKPELTLNSIGFEQLLDTYQQAYDDRAQ